MNLPPHTHTHTPTFTVPQCFLRASQDSQRAPLSMNVTLDLLVAAQLLQLTIKANG